MKNKLLASFVLLAGFLMVSGTVSAHHGAAALAMDKEVTLKGTVTNWQWTNPHCIISLDVTDSTGKVTNWSSETSPPIGMIQGGWNRNTLKPGDKITLVLHVARSGAPVGRTVQVITADGKKLMGTPGATAAENNPNAN
jgi:hypothetical protein